MTIVFDIEWTQPEGIRDPFGGAWGRGRLRVGGESVWGLADGIEWRWADLLEHLTEIWPWLVWEQSYPIDVRPFDLARLRPEAERRWERFALDEASIDAEDDRLHAWEHRHYLNQGLGALYVAAVGVLREGRCAQVVANGQVWRWPLTEVLADLGQIGDRLAAQVSLSERAECQALVALWRDRLNVEPRRRASIEAGVPLRAVDDVLCQAVDQLDSLEEAPLLAAARMTRGARVSDAEWRELARIIVGLVPTPISAELQSLGSAALAALGPLSGLRPFEQGVALAAWLRGVLKRSGRIEPADLLKKWKVPVFDDTFAESLDAMALWSDGAAAVVVNTNGPHARSQAGRRATLAHEIAHLLVDRQTALPAIEVLGGVVPWHLEQRANAFAAELLVPSAEVAEAVKVAGVSGSALLRRLCERYRASREIVAWQVCNSGAFDLLSVEDQRPFREAVGRRWIG